MRADIGGLPSPSVFAPLAVLVQLGILLQRRLFRLLRIVLLPVCEKEGQHGGDRLHRVHHRCAQESQPEDRNQKQGQHNRIDRGCRGDEQIEDRALPMAQDPEEDTDTAHHKNDQAGHLDISSHIGNIAVIVKKADQRIGYQSARQRDGQIDAAGDIGHVPAGNKDRDEDAGGDQNAQEIQDTASDTHRQNGVRPEKSGSQKADKEGRKAVGGSTDQPENGQLSVELLFVHGGILPFFSDADIIKHILRRGKRRYLQSATL